LYLFDLMLSRQQVLLVVGFLFLSASGFSEAEDLAKKKKKHHHHRHQHGERHLAEIEGGHHVNHSAFVTSLPEHAVNASNGTVGKAEVRPSAVPANASKPLEVSRPAALAAAKQPQTAKPVAKLMSTKTASSVVQKVAGKAVAAANVPASLHKSKAQPQHNAHHKTKAAARRARGQISVSGPLPPDFEERFVKGVVQATGTSADSIRVQSVAKSKEADNVADLVFTAPQNVAEAVEDQAADPDSKLAKGILHIFLIDRSSDADSQQGEEGAEHQEAQPTHFVATRGREQEEEHGSDEEAPDQEPPSTPARDNGIDIDGEMPYGDLEPFGREDTAEELTDSSIRESDEMVDQLERAEVAEEKRAVFRALTRLRGAAITSFDGIARSQTGNIDEYNKKYQWRETHPLHHLADEESDVNRWAFPKDEDC
jgi:hypothetical protein